MKHWYNNGISEISVEDTEPVPDNYVKGRLPKKNKTQLYIEQFINSVNIEEFKEYCKGHFQTNVIETYNIPNRKVASKLYKHLGLKTFSNMKGRKPTRTHESYILGGEKSRRTQKVSWENKSEEEKLAWSKLMSESHSTPQYARIKLEQNRAYRDSLTQEQREIMDKQRSESMKCWWRGLSEKEKWEQINKQFNGGAGYHSANSKPNLLFKKLLETNNVEFTREYRIDMFSYDFKVHNTVIEINPTFTHNSTYSPFDRTIYPEYHLDKTLKATSEGLRCIHIWDWDNIELIANSLKTPDKIYARNCTIGLVDKSECDKFLELNHFQGTCRGQDIRIGLFYNGELIQIMTFGKPRYNKNYEYELLRLCTKCGYKVIGGSQRLMSHFRKNYTPNSIISYCDKSKFTGDVYIKLGMQLKGISGPACHWYNLKTHKHITDNLLRYMGFDRLLGKEYGTYGKGTNNEELMLTHGFVKIFDCGQYTYTLNLKNV